MAEIKLSRKELYDLVWSEPLTSIAKKYKISDVGLRKRCLKLLVPIPDKGYWRKIQIGQKIIIPPLPGEEMVTLTIRREDEMINPLVVLEKEIVNDNELPLEVPKKLINPDKLIVETENYLTNKDAPRSQGWDKLDISVSSEYLDRALLFMDTFIKLLRSRGHDVKVEQGNTYAIMGDENVEIRFREKLKKVPRNDRWNSIDYMPSGILSLTSKTKYLYKTSEWKDGKLSLDEQLHKILAKLEINAKEERVERLRVEKTWADREERERQEKELKLNKEKELTDFKRLLKEAKRWHEATVLRNYIRNKEATLSENNIDLEFINWKEWAYKKVDWFDPFIEAEDNLLINVERNSLV